VSYAFSPFCFSPAAGRWCAVSPLCSCCPAPSWARACRHRKPSFPCLSEPATATTHPQTHTHTHRLTHTSPILLDDWRNVRVLRRQTHGHLHYHCTAHRTTLALHPVIHSGVLLSIPLVPAHSPVRLFVLVPWLSSDPGFGTRVSWNSCGDALTTTHVAALFSLSLFSLFTLSTFYILARLSIVVHLSPASRVSPSVNNISYNATEHVFAEDRLQRLQFHVLFVLHGVELTYDYSPAINSPTITLKIVQRQSNEKTTKTDPVLETYIKSALPYLQPES
jgi:hypothetical protein